MLTLALTFLYWRSVVIPPTFRPEDIAAMRSAEGVYQSKVNAGRDLSRRAPVETVLISEVK